MYITASSSASSLLRATRSKLSSSSISRTFANHPSSTRTFSSSAARSFCYSVPRWNHRLDWCSPFSLRPQIRAVAPVIERFHRKIATMANENPFKGNLTSLPKPGGGEFGNFYSLPSLNDPRVDRLPYSIRILLESAIRNCDNFQVTKEDVEKIIDWENSCAKQVEIPFKPARVLLQDFTGVPAVVDLACMRDAMNKLGSDSNKINPLRHKASGQDTNVLAGAGYGNGSSRVWAAKGPMLLGVNAVMARSFERNVDTDSLGLTGHKRFMSDVTGTISETKAYSLRPLSPHLPLYQPQLSSTLSIINRISGALLSTVILLFYMIYMKMGLISLSYDSFYQFLFYSSKLHLLAVELSGLALSYHLYAGIRHLVHKL